MTGPSGGGGHFYLNIPVVKMGVYCYKMLSSVVVNKAASCMIEVQ